MRVVGPVIGLERLEKREYTMKTPQGPLTCSVAAACAALLLVPNEAHAYIGPGVGISAIGSFFALLGAIVFAIVGFVWYPVKRLMRAVKRKRDTGKAETSSPA